MDGQLDARTPAPMSRLRSLSLVAIAALLELLLIARSSIASPTQTR
jgi:hypothetical protein